MGINASSTEFLLQAHASGVSFRETLTLGRQNLSVNGGVLEKLFKRYGVSGPGEAPPRGASLEHDLPHPADPLFRALAAVRVDSIDAAAYQCSSIVHDMNLPVPPGLHRRYDCVVDGGTLEHIFAFPTAIRNCMEMVKVGGHLILMTPANNYFGHGFYQFSPEMFYRVLSPENGFCVQRMVAIETENLVYRAPGGVRYYEKHGRPYDVLDPAVTGKRGTLRNGKSVLLYVQAERRADVPLFARTPQQSDYVTQWQESGQGMRPQPPDAPDDAPPAPAALRDRVTRLVPPAIRLRYHQQAASFRNRSSFR